MIRPALLLPALALAGCGNFGSPYSWDATQANRINTASSAERPYDLVQGRGAAGGDANAAAAAIERLRYGTPVPLASFTTSRVGLIGGGGNNPAPADASTGTAGGGAPPAAGGS